MFKSEWTVMSDKDERDQEAQEVLATLSEKDDSELREILDDLYAEESRLSYRRRVLHARIDIVREELVRRMKGSAEKGELMVGKEDIDRLSEILAREGSRSSAFRHVDTEELGKDDVFK